MLKRKVHVREASPIARIAAMKLGCTQVAIVFGHTIHLHNTSTEAFFANPAWVCHELKHVEQYERHGVLPFLMKYLLEHLRKGYQNNAFEVEARAAEGDIDLPSRFDLGEYGRFTENGY